MCMRIKCPSGSLLKRIKELEARIESLENTVVAQPKDLRYVKFDPDYNEKWTVKKLKPGD